MDVSIAAGRLCLKCNFAHLLRFLCTEECCEGMATTAGIDVGSSIIITDENSCDSDIVSYSN